ncbi:hypothetical protein C5167_031052 [Papaver somniferum]|nr:hypothetical protein C5167_031052 [Papaver somniferum]
MVQDLAEGRVASLMIRRWPLGNRKGSWIIKKNGRDSNSKNLGSKKFVWEFMELLLATGVLLTN